MKFSKKYLFLTSLSVIFLAFSGNYLFADTSSDEPVSVKEKKDQEGYVLDLKGLINKSKEKIEKVNEKLEDQARERRNQQREEKAREYYNKGMALWDDKKYAEAQEYFQKAVKITEHPEMKNFVSESARRSQKQEEALSKEENHRIKRLEIERGYSASEVEEAYQAAVALYKQQKYLAAKEEFDRVDEMFPDHKATRSYLMIVEQAIQEEQQKIIDEKLRQEAIAKRKEKEEWRREVEQKEKERETAVMSRAETLYEDAMKLYKMRQFEQAKAKFQEIEWIYPEYKNTQKYLSGIDDDIRNSEKNRLVEQQKAQERELEEKRLAAQNQETQERRKIELEERARQEKIAEEAGFVYQAAVSLYKKKFYPEAKEKFLDVEKISPDYKSVKSYISKIDSILDEQKQTRETRKEKADDQEIVQKPKPEADFEEKDGSSGQKQRDQQKRLRYQAQSNYAIALDLFKQKKYFDAKDKFTEVQSIMPDYKSTRQYLEKIEQQLAKGQATPIKETSRDERRNSEESPAVKVPVLSEDAVVKKAVEERDRKISAEADEKYKEAIKFYQQQDYWNAKAKFIQVEAVSPNYKDALSYLSKIDDQINRLGGNVAARKKKPNVGSEDSQSIQMKVVKTKKSASPSTGSKVEISQEREKLPWEEAQEKRVSELKAKEEYLETLEGERYKEFRRRMLDEQKEMDRVEKDRKRQDALRRKAQVKRLEEERKKVLEEQALQEKIKLDNQKQEELRVREEARLAKEKEKQERELKLAEEKERLKRLKQEEIENKKKAEQLAKEMEEKHKLLMEQMKKEKEALDLRNKEEQDQLVSEITEAEKAAEEQAALQKKQEEAAKAEAVAALSLQQATEQKAFDEYVYNEVKQEVENEKIRRDRKIDDRRDRFLKKKQKQELIRYQKDIARSLSQKEAEQRKKWGGDVEALYEESMRLYKEGDYEAAKAKLSMVEGMQPGYKLAKLHISSIENRMLAQENALTHEYERRAQEERIKKKRAEREAEKEKKLEEIKKQKEAEEEQIMKQKQAEDEQKAKELQAKKEALEKKKEEELKAKQEMQKKREEQREQKKQKGQKDQTKGEGSPAPSESSPVVSNVPKDPKKEEAKQDVVSQRQKEKLLKQEKLREIEKQKRERAEQELARKKAEKERKEFEAKKSREEKIKLAEQQKKLKKDIEAVYQESLRLYRENQAALAQEKYKKYEGLLASGQFSEDYLTQMRDRLRKDQEMIQKEDQKRREQEEKIVRQRQDAAKKAEQLAQQHKQTELEQLQRKIKMQEEQLAKDKQREMERLNLEKQKSDRARAEAESKKLAAEAAKLREKKTSSTVELEEVRVKADSQIAQMADKQKKVSSQKAGVLSEEDKKKELERLVKERQAELRARREQVQKELNDQLSLLYEKAVKLHQKGINDQAKVIFSQIESMQPGYKNTKNFLKKIDGQLNQGSSENIAEQEKMDRASLKRSRRPAPSQKSREELISEALNSVEIKAQ